MNKIIILALVFSGLMGVGVLGNIFLIDIQPLGLFASLDELPGSSCSCANSEGIFSPENCNQFMEDFTDSPEMVCDELALALNGGTEMYGDIPLETQGCNADFWLNNKFDPASSSVWPPGYSPKYYFNEIFQVSITLPVQEDNKELDGESETSSSTLEAVDENVNAIGVTEEIPLEPLENITSSDTETVEDEVASSLAVNVENSNSDNGINLAEALELQGTPLNDLLRESVSAMLNAAHSEIDYPYTVAEIITMTQIALANEEFDETVIILKEANDRGNTSICNA